MSSRFKDDIYQECDYVTLCCSLCWKRGWDFSNPLLGRDQPEWQNYTEEHVKDVLGRRYRHWEECAVDKQYEERFKWRLPLLKLQDDMTLESDRNLVKAMKNGFLKKSSKFTSFAGNAVSKASPPSGATFDIRNAFNDIKRVLCDFVPPSAANDREAEVEGQREWRQDAEESVLEHGQLPPLRTAATRPQRQASRLSFVTGQPVRHLPFALEEDAPQDSMDNDQDLLDQEISSPISSKPPPSQGNKSFRRQTSNNDTPRRRGRPRKLPIASAPLPPSPSTPGDNTAQGSSFMQDEVADYADSDPDDSFNQVKTIFNQKQREIRGLREDRARQMAQIRLIKDELERSRASTQELEHELKEVSTSETSLRDTLSGAEAEKLALQHTISGSVEGHKRQLQTIAELNKKVAMQEAQNADIQRLHLEIMDYERKQAELEADLQASRAQVGECSSELNDQREALEELQQTHAQLKQRYAEIEEENQGVYKGIARRDQKLADLQKLSSNKSNAIRTSREGEDEVMELNKQLRKDIANIGAELALERGLSRGYEIVNGARLEEALALGSLKTDLLGMVRGSLTAEVMDRLAQSPFIEAQMAEKIQERIARSQKSSDDEPSQTNSAKRRRMEPLADVTEPSWPRVDSEMYD